MSLKFQAYWVTHLCSRGSATVSSPSSSSIAVPSVFDPKKIKIEVNAYIEDENPAIKETWSYVKYSSPMFIANATVTVPEMKSLEHWEIGWVQALHKSKNVNTYGELGMSSWEFPELNRGLEMINDSDGVNYPFYGHIQFWPRNWNYWVCFKMQHWV